jgi:PKD repeat protein
VRANLNPPGFRLYVYDNLKKDAPAGRVKIDEVTGLNGTDNYQMLAALYDATYTGTITLEVEMIDGPHGGNDAALDDISFKEVCCEAADPTFRSNCTEYQCGQQVTFTATTQSGTHQWYVNDILQSSTTYQFSHTFAGAAAYTVKHKITSAPTGCNQQTEEIRIIVGGSCQ